MKRLLLLLVICGTFAGCFGDGNLTKRELSRDAVSIAEAQERAHVSDNDKESSIAATVAAAAKGDDSALITLLVIIGVIALAGAGGSMYLYDRAAKRKHDLSLREHDLKKELLMLARQGSFDEPPMPLFVRMFIEMNGGVPFYKDRKWEVVDGRTGNVKAVLGDIDVQRH